MFRLSVFWHDALHGLSLCTGLGDQIDLQPHFFHLRESLLEPQRLEESAVMEV